MIGDVTERGDFLLGFGRTPMSNDPEVRRLHRGGVGADGESIGGGSVRGWVGVDLYPKLDRWVIVVGNVQAVARYQPWPSPNQTMADVDVVTGPGCFAYPDQMEVGSLGSFVEERSHFGLWVCRGPKSTLNSVSPRLCIII